MEKQQHSNRRIKDKAEDELKKTGKSRSKAVNSPASDELTHEEMSNQNGAEEQVLLMQETRGNAYVCSMLEKIEAEKGSGQQIAPFIRAGMEQSLGKDLSGVRIHRDSNANKLAKDIGAKAFTAGKHIYFRAGHYNPETEAGRELIAHEVIHTLQTDNNTPEKLIDSSHDPAELEATSIAAGTTNENYATSPIQAISSAAIQRAEEEKPEWLTKKGEVEMEAETVKAEKNIDFALRIQSGVNMAATRAGLNALSYTEEVRDAIADFEKHYSAKIEELEGQVTAGQLVLELADAVLTVLQPEAKLIEAAATAIGKELADHIYKKLTDALKKPVEDFGKTDTASLKKAIATLSQRARDRAANIRDEVDSVMRRLANPIVAKIQNGETLSGEEEAFAAEVYMADLDQIDAALIKRGVPAAKGNYGPILSALSTQFEIYYIKATYYWSDLMRMGFAEWAAGSLEAAGGVSAEAKTRSAPFVEERLKARKSEKAPE